MHRLLAATCLALCCAAPAQATDWSGIWRYETCETGGDSWVIAAGLEAVLSEADFYTAPVKISHAPTAGNWHSLHSADGYRYYVAMTEAEELVFLDLTEEATDRYSDAVNSGRVTPETHRDIWEETLYHRCDALPASSRLLFGELASVMLSLDAAMAGCSANESADRCVAQIVQALDLSGDEALNRAELSRALRAGTLFAAGLTEDWTPNSDGVIAQLAAAPTAPLLAMMLLGSFDYSGDGALDAVEISADRFTNLPTTALSNALPDEAALNALLEQQLMTLLPLFMAITE